MSEDEIIRLEANEESNHCENCDYIKKTADEVVYIEQKALMKITLLNGRNDNIEWTAYLIGKGDRIKDIYFMEQEASAGCVEISEKGLKKVENVIGIIHSHHTMYSVKWSSQDRETMKNYKYSILTWNDNKMIGTTTVKLPCGLIKDKEVEIKALISKDEEELLQEFEKSRESEYKKRAEEEERKDKKLTEFKDKNINIDLEKGEKIEKTGDKIRIKEEEDNYNEAMICEECYTLILNKCKVTECELCGETIHKSCFKEHMKRHDEEMGIKYHQGNYEY